MSSQHGGAIIGEHLARHGVQFMFTLCGGHISPILTGARAAGIRVVDVRDEKHAVFAADAVARMTGTVGVAAVTAGPGVTNTITAIKNAQMAQSPIILFGGATPTILKGRGALQDIDQLVLLKPLTKWATSVRTVKSLGPVVDKAIEVATSGTPGPVFIEVPVDVLYPEEIVRQWFMSESGVQNAKTFGAKALQLYLKGHLYRQFNQPHIPVDFANPIDQLTQTFDALPLDSVPFPIGRDTEALIDAAADALRTAKQPVLVIGSQALANCSPARAEELADAVRLLGLPVWLGGTSRGLLGKTHDAQFRHQRSKALKEADVVVIAGFPFDFRLGYGRKINRKATLIAANLNTEDLRKNRRPDIGVQMHSADFLIKLAERLGSLGPFDGWLATLTEREQARDAEIAEMAGEPSELINPLDFFLRLEAKMADNSVMVVDGGDFVATASYIISPRRPLSWLDPGVFGTLGVGGGFAVGAALCRPSAEVWLIYGDGSSAYSLSEFDTCVRHGLAPIAVIGTDGSWAQIAREQVEILDDDIGTTLLRTDYHKVAEGYGAVGLLLTDPAKIDETLDEAKRLAASGKPVCVNVHINKSDFRKGSISM